MLCEQGLAMKCVAKGDSRAAGKGENEEFQKFQTFIQLKAGSSVHHLAGDGHQSTIQLWEN